LKEIILGAEKNAALLKQITHFDITLAALRNEGLDLFIRKDKANREPHVLGYWSFFAYRCCIPTPFLIAMIHDPDLDSACNFFTRQDGAQIPIPAYEITRSRLINQTLFEEDEENMLQLDSAVLVVRGNGLKVEITNMSKVR